MSFNSTATPSIDLRPLSAGQLFDRALRLYRNNFLTFVGIIALTQIFIVAANVVLILLAPAPEVPLTGTSLDDNPFWNFVQSFSQASSSSSVFGTYVVGFISWALTVIGGAALTRAAFDAYFGNPGTIMDGYRKMKGAWWTLLGATFISGLVGSLLSLWWIFIPLVGWFTGLGMIIFYSLVVYPFMTPIVIVEDREATQALPRALELGQRRFWWFIGFLLLLGIFSQVIVTAPTLLVVGGVEAIFGSDLSPLMSTIIYQTIQLLFNIIYVPIQLTCILLLYLDVRVRTEGLDLALKTNMDVNDVSPKEPTTIAAEAPSITSGYFPGRENLKLYLFLTLICYGVYLGIVAIITLFGIMFSSLG